MSSDSRAGLNLTPAPSSHAINPETLFLSLLLALSPSRCLQPQQRGSVRAEHQRHAGLAGCPALQELPHGVDPGSPQRPAARGALGRLQHLLRGQQDGEALRHVLSRGSACLQLLQPREDLHAAERFYGRQLLSGDQRYSAVSFLPVLPAQWRMRLNWLRAFQGKWLFYRAFF